MLSNVTDIKLADLVNAVAARLPQHFRLVTITCTDAGEYFDLLYHFDKDYELSHLRLQLPKGQELPSISGVYFAAVIVENELQDLFGIRVTGMAVDYGGKLLLSEGAPIAPLTRQVTPPAPKSPGQESA